MTGQSAFRMWRFLAACALRLRKASFSRTLSFDQNWCAKLQNSLTRRKFFRSSAAAITAFSLPTSLLLTGRASAAVGWLAIASAVWTLYSSSQKKAIPDTLTPTLLEIHKQIGALHDRLTGIEIGIAGILIRLEELKDIATSSVTNGLAADAAYDLNARSAAFVEFMVSKPTERSLREQLVDVTHFSRKLMNYSDVHIVSLCAAAHTELAGHIAANSGVDQQRVTAQAYLAHFNQSLDQDKEGKLANLIALAESKEKSLWLDIETLLRGYSKQEKKGRSKFVGTYGIQRNPIFGVGEVYRPQEFDGTSKWSLAYAVENTYSQYNPNLKKLFGGCVHVIFRETDSSEPLFEKGRYKDTYGGKKSTIYARTTSCMHTETVPHAIHDLLVTLDVTVEESGYEFPDPLLRKVMKLNSPKYTEVKMLNSSKAHFRGKPISDLKSLQLEFSDRGQFYENPEMVFGPQRRGKRLVFHTGELDNGQPHVVADELKSKKDYFERKKEDLDFLVSNLNDTIDALAAFRFAAFARNETAKFLQAFA